MNGRLVGMLAALVAMIALAACQPIMPPQDGATQEPAAQDAAPAGQEVTLYVGPELVDCVGVGPMKCMLVKENPEEDYKYFYSQIEGFEFEPGYEYELRVLVTPVENAPADASSLQYTLIEVVSKEPVVAESAESAGIEGATWQLVSVADDSGALVEVPAGVEATATFADGTVSGSSGCNNYSASYTLDGDSLSIMPGPMTMMACPEPQMSVEMQLMAAYGATASFAISDGQLTLLDGTGNPVATFAVLEPASLTGITWVALFYNNGRGAAVSVLADTQITAIFGDDGSLSGSAGCNNYMGGYTTDGSSIAIEPPASTRKACPDAIMQQEAEYLLALPTAATFTIQGDKLELRTADGALVASYVAGGN